jgi:hypothetical protein
MGGSEEILNSKHQIPNNIKAQNTNDQNSWNFDIRICLELRD